jgi:hypothetical protein
VLLAVTVLSLGCGAVLFLPSPYTPQNVDLIYSPQEDITIVRWRISSSAPLGDDLQFQILDDNGWQTIDFSQSLFPGGPSACGDGVGSCFQYVVRGQYPVDMRPRPLRAVHSTYGTLPGALASSETAPESLVVASWFHTNNDFVVVSVADLVAYDGPYRYPRSYDRTMWPTNGLCVSDSPPAGVSFSPLDGSYGQAPSAMLGFPPDLPLTESGIYCVGVRPIPVDAGAAALAQARVATLPQLTNMQESFVPPVEVSPVIYQIVLDLEIPVPDQCPSSISTIESLVDKYMNMAGGAPVTKLPTMNLAVDPNGTDGAANCHQLDGRALPAADMAEAVMKTVSSYPETFQQFHFLYFNNLNVPLPQSMTDSLQALFDALSAAPDPYQLRTISWLFNPGLARATGPQWTIPDPPWLTAADPSFEMTLKSYVQQNLPYTSQTYDSSIPVPLMSPDAAAMYDGALFKICDSAPAVQPAYTSPVMPLFGAYSWTIKASDPPGYLVNLPYQADVPGPQFHAASASVDFQICTEYCDHPYVSTAGTGATSWKTSPLCGGLD